ncbi:hypothetical protein ACFFX0_02665 [Citricoccus parietis]|uniref:Uncharacterized protein n=1 Tax=Citricoccus parietis TaxID=592307 RepID=A0ABV5FTZ1_9MICC
MVGTGRASQGAVAASGAAVPGREGGGLRSGDRGVLHGRGLLSGLRRGTSDRAGDCGAGARRCPDGGTRGGGRAQSGQRGRLRCADPGCAGTNDRPGGDHRESAGAAGGAEASARGSRGWAGAGARGGPGTVWGLGERL